MNTITNSFVKINLRIKNQSFLTFLNGRETHPKFHSTVIFPSGFKTTVS